MKRSITNGLAAVAVAVLLGACATKVVKEEQYSGFLKDYSQLKEEKDAAGDPVMRHISPKLTSGAYRQIMIDRIEFYPPPQPNANVDAATLEQIRAYLDQQLRKKVGERVTVVPVVNQPGPGVVRMRAAITGARGERADLAFYEYIPIGLVIAGTREAAGVRAKDARIYVEVELLDSVSGERVGAVVKKGTGEAVKGGESGKLALEHVKPVLDHWAQLAADFAASNLRPTR
jgi:hypothetical protein